MDVLAGTRYTASALVGGQRPVPCTSIIERKSDHGSFEQVPTRYIVDTDGMYRFKQQPIAVWAPKDCITDLAIYTGDRSVDFDAVTQGERECHHTRTRSAGAR